MRTAPREVLQRQSGPHDRAQDPLVHQISLGDELRADAKVPMLQCFIELVGFVAQLRILTLARTSIATCVAGLDTRDVTRSWGGVRLIGYGAWCAAQDRGGVRQT